MESQYTKKAPAVRNNMDIKLFYRQADYTTARDIAESVGYRSGFARSQTLRDGRAATDGLSEQAVYVFTPRDVMELDPENVIVLFSNRKPMWLKRMDWQTFPLLRQRRAIPPPPVQPLPALQEHGTERSAEEKEAPDSPWQLERDLLHGRKAASFSNGFRKKQGKTL